MHTWQLMIILYIMYWIFSELTGKVAIVHTSNPDDPLLLFDEHYLDNESLDIVSRFVRSHEIIEHTTKSAEAGEGFALKTWAECNVEGLRKLCYSEELRVLCPAFINDVKAEGANTFVLKVYLGLPTTFNRTASFYTASGGIIGFETNPAVTDRWNMFVPQQVNIFHLEVPEGIVGGELQVFEDIRREEREMSYLSAQGPAHVQKVRSNSLHSLRGDSYYSFTDFDVPNDGRKPELQRRVSLILQQYALSNEAYTETITLRLWEPPKPSMQGALVFGAMLFACAGGGIGVIVSLPQQKEGKIWYVVLCVFIGFAFAGAVGFAASYALGVAWLQFTELLVFINSWCQDHFIVSPTATAWFLITLSLTVLWTVLVMGGGYLFRNYGGDNVDNAAQMLQAFVSGESNVSLKTRRAIPAKPPHSTLHKVD